MTSRNTKRIVLLGKTGAGKSSLANTMFKEKLFTVNHSPNSETATCEAKTGSVNGREVTLIDSPGFFDTDRSEEEMKSEIVRCIIECSPGPHAFLIVLKVEKYTEHEKAVISKMCDYFSQEVFKYATVLFTHGDQLPEGQTIQDFIRVNDSLNDFVKKCSGGCHVIDNKYWNQNATGYRSNHYQVEEVLKTIDNIVQANNKCCYTNKMLQDVEEEIKEQEEKISKALVSMSEELSTVLSTEQIREQAIWSYFLGRNTKRIVLLGKTGAGKSSLANTMFKEKLFTVNHSPNSETATCEAKTGSVNGREVTLIDCPGFFDTDRSEEEMKSEIVRCIIESSPGPHAFLIVLKVEKYTEHAKAVISKMCDYFSQEVFKYATVLFTHGDQLPEGQTIQDFIRVNDSLNDFVKKCSGGCHVIDNKYWNQNATGYRSNHYQVEEVLKTIDNIVQANNKCCYTNKMLQDVEEEIKEQEEKISKALVSMSEELSTVLSTEQIREQAKDNVYKKWKDAGLTVVSILGAFLGVALAVLKVLR